jgi:hypothetical protein
VGYGDDPCKHMAYCLWFSTVRGVVAAAALPPRAKCAADLVRINLHLPSACMGWGEGGLGHDNDIFWWLKE